MQCSKGYKKKEGECVRVKKNYSSKKSYNPFKMWGSWIGLGVYILLILTIILYGYNKCNGELIGCSTQPGFISKIIGFPSILFSPNDLGAIGFGFTSILIFQPIFYFIAGWGIHSLIRRYK